MEGIVENGHGSVIIPNVYTTNRDINVNNTGTTWMPDQAPKETLSPQDMNSLPRAKVKHFFSLFHTCCKH